MSITHREMRSPGPGSQLADLFLVQMSNWRWSWPQLVLTGFMTPVASLVALGFFAGRSDPVTLEHLLVGTIVLAVLFQNLNQVAGNFAFMRANGSLDFFATLPVARTSLVAATVGAFFVLSIPATVVTVLVGQLVLGIDVTVSPAVVVVLPLAVLPIGAVGALLGTVTHSLEETNAFSLVATFALAGLGPVLARPDHLPPLVQALGNLNPATYAASALRQALIGPLSGRLLVDAAVLAGFGAAVLLAEHRLLAWRNR